MARAERCRLAGRNNHYEAAITAVTVKEMERPFKLLSKTRRPDSLRPTLAVTWHKLAVATRTGTLCLSTVGGQARPGPEGCELTQFRGANVTWSEESSLKVTQLAGNSYCQQVSDCEGAAVLH